MKMVSLNVRGVQNFNKRHKIWRYLKNTKADVCFIQESHGTNKDNSIWSHEWGNKIVFSNGESNARGVAILFKRFHDCVTEIIRDVAGRYLLVKIEVEGLTYCLGNIYAPNEDNPAFFQSVFKEIKNMDCVFNILGGDYNVVQNPNMDRNDDKRYNNLALETIKDWQIEEGMWDVWRIRNPEGKRFTWVKSRPVISWSRLDYFLISENLVAKTLDSDIMPCIHTDHSAVKLEVNISDNKRGPGSWKINDNFLNDETFVRNVTDLVLGIRRIHDYLDECELWELIKSEVVKFCKQFGRNKARIAEENKFELYKILSAIQEKLVRNDANEHLLTNMNRVKNEIDSYETRDAQRSAFRCKREWIRLGEKPSKYFLNLEKRNYTKKTMYVVTKKDGSLTKDYREILNVQHQFYEELYTRDNRVSFNMTNDSNIKLDITQKMWFEETLTKNELFDALMTLKSGKCPGSDGLSLAFYRKFWNVLSEPLFRCLCSSITNGKLHPSARRGIINLIPKKGKSGLQVKDWRPISLLNYDFKLYAKAIANRLEVATDLIGKQQNGFIKDRSMTTNILHTVEILGYLDRSNKPGIVAVIDFEKCFDRIDHQSIKKVFKYFNFGEHFLEMLMLLYNDLELCTINNGYLSEFFQKGRGINQGCPASPLVYSYCGEILNHLITANDNIKGIPYQALKNLLSQFADDTCAFLKYEQLSLNCFSSALEDIEAQMGLKVSYEKTTLYRLGSLQHTNASLYTQKNYAWSSGTITTLGVKLKCDGSPDNANFEELLSKLKEICQSWSNRRLSLTGRVLVVNALMTSLFVHKMLTLPDLPAYIVKKANELITEFVWVGKRPKISMVTLKKMKSQGGLKLIDLVTRQKSLKIATMLRSKEDEFLQSCMCNQLCNVAGERIWSCNLRSKDVSSHFDCTKYWGQTLLAWSVLNYQKHLDTKKAIQNQILWWNSNIRINNRPILYKKWTDKGIWYIRDIVDENGHCKSALELNVNWLELKGIFETIPTDWKHLLKQMDVIDNEPYETLYDKLSKITKPTKIIYDMFIDDDKHLLKYLNRWEQDNFTFDLLTFSNDFHRLNAIKIIKFKDFQYRLLLKKVTTNVQLAEWKISQSNMCRLCNLETEELTHLFYNCTKVLPIVHKLYEICLKDQINIEYGVEALLFNRLHEDANHIVNLISIQLKQMIYRQACQGKPISINAWLKEVVNLYDMEYANAKHEFKSETCKKRWSPIIHSICTMTVT